MIRQPANVILTEDAKPVSAALADSFRVTVFGVQQRGTRVEWITPVTADEDLADAIANPAAHSLRAVRAFTSCRGA